MDKLIMDFSEQLKEAMAIGQAANISKPSREIRNVVVSGLGGSGIGANLTGELVVDELQVPFMVNKDYFLPDFVNEFSLVIISSYSGNTEETVHALNIARTKKATIICVTSNGKILEIATENKLDYIQIPEGMPPRACLGYSFVQQLFILNKLGLIGNKRIEELDKAVKLLDEQMETIQSSAKELAEKLYEKIPVIYVAADMESVAVRFRQQLNENSKILAWHHAIPEMNHNELVGWRDRNNDLAVVFLRNETDFERIQQRMEISRNVISNCTDHIYDIFSKGNSKTERALYLIHLTDWTSFYLAQLRSKDAVEVKVIDHLKGELAKQPF